VIFERKRFRLPLHVVTKLRRKLQAGHIEGEATVCLYRANDSHDGIALIGRVARGVVERDPLSGKVIAGGLRSTANARTFAVAIEAGPVWDEDVLVHWGDAAMARVTGTPLKVGESRLLPTRFDSVSGAVAGIVEKFQAEWSMLILGGDE